ncbi:unnamed protein product, partial [Tuber aestivum]
LWPGSTSVLFPLAFLSKTFFPFLTQQSLSCFIHPILAAFHLPPPFLFQPGGLLHSTICLPLSLPFPSLTSLRIARLINDGTINDPKR